MTPELFFTTSTVLLLTLWLRWDLLAEVKL